MAEGWGQAIGAIGSALINAGASTANNYLNVQENRYLQRKAQQWQERMSSTAHQREVVDLLKAGINPLYTATGGNGASTGTVGSNSALNTQVPQVGTDVMNGLMTLSSMRNQTNSTNADVALKGIQGQELKVQMLERMAHIDKMKSDMSLNRYQEHKLDAEIKQVWANIRQLDTLSDLNVTNATYISDKNKREKYLTAGEQAASLNRIEQIKAHPTLSYMLDYLRGSRYLK